MQQQQLVYTNEYMKDHIFVIYKFIAKYQCGQID